MCSTSVIIRTAGLIIICVKFSQKRACLKLTLKPNNYLTYTKPVEIVYKAVLNVPKGEREKKEPVMCNPFINSTIRTGWFYSKLCPLWELI